MIQEEGVDLASEPKLNFIGTYITCVDNAGVSTDCTIVTPTPRPTDTPIPTPTAYLAYDTVIDDSGTLTQRRKVFFTGAGVTCVDNGGSAQTDCTITGSAVSAYDTVQEEGSSLTQRTTINFIGSYITCIDNASKTECTIVTPTPRPTDTPQPTPTVATYYVERELSFFIAGNQYVHSHPARLYVNATTTIKDARCSVNTAPTGSSLIVDVNLDGTTIFSTQANRPTIAISGFTAVSGTPNTTSASSGSYFSIDVDQIGSTLPGSDLVCQVRIRQAAFTSS